MPATIDLNPQPDFNFQQELIVLDADGQPTDQRVFFVGYEINAQGHRNGRGLVNPTTTGNVAGGKAVARRSNTFSIALDRLAPAQPISKAKRDQLMAEYHQKQDSYDQLKFY